MKKEIRFLILMMLRILIVKMRNHQHLERKRKKRTMIIMKLTKQSYLVVLLDWMEKTILSNNESRPNFLKTKSLVLTGQLTSTWIDDSRLIARLTNLMLRTQTSLSSSPNIRLQHSTFIAVKLQRKWLRPSKYLLSPKESLSTT